MKFDYVIGNPPYQEIVKNNGRMTPLYHLFMDASYKLSDCVLLITPGRFLKRAGQTPKAWIEKMLDDEHFHVLYYEPVGSKIFQGPEIKGGIAITIRDQNRLFEKIGVFKEFSELDSILQKVLDSSNSFLSSICIGAVPYRFTDKVKDDYPEYIEDIGESFDLRTNILDKMNQKLFYENKSEQEGFVKIYGLKDKKRSEMWIKKEYVSGPDNYGKFKVLVPKAVGSGRFGETMSKMIISAPNTGHTQSFVSIGNFDSEIQALNLEKYLKTKFARTLLGLLHTTPDITPSKLEYIPILDFGSSSDIKWDVSIKEIDVQLYKKYNLSPEEIEFVESNVKDMS